MASGFICVVTVFACLVATTVADGTTQGILYNVTTTCGKNESDDASIVLTSLLSFEVKAFCRDGVVVPFNTTDDYSYHLDVSYPDGGSHPCVFEYLAEAGLYVVELVPSISESSIPVEFTVVPCPVFNNEFENETTLNVEAGNIDSYQIVNQLNLKRQMMKRRASRTKRETTEDKMTSNDQSSDQSRFYMQTALTLLTTEEQILREQGNESDTTYPSTTAQSTDSPGTDQHFVASHTIEDDPLLAPTDSNITLSVSQTSEVLIDVNTQDELLSSNKDPEEIGHGEDLITYDGQLTNIDPNSPQSSEVVIKEGESDANVTGDKNEIEDPLENGSEADVNEDEMDHNQSLHDKMLYSENQDQPNISFENNSNSLQSREVVISEGNYVEVKGQVDENMQGKASENADFDGINWDEDSVDINDISNIEDKVDDDEVNWDEVNDDEVNWEEVNDDEVNWDKVNDDEVNRDVLIGNRQETGPSNDDASLLASDTHDENDGLNTTTLVIDENGQLQGQDSPKNDPLTEKDWLLEQDSPINDLLNQEQDDQDGEADQLIPGLSESQGDVDLDDEGRGSGIPDTSSNEGSEELVNSSINKQGLLKDSSYSSGRGYEDSEDSQEKTSWMPNERVVGNGGLSLVTLEIVDVLGRKMEIHELQLGRTIQLRAVSDGTGKEAGIRPDTCYALGSQNNYTILGHGCGDGEVIPETLGFNTTGRQSTSPFLQVFTEGADTVLSFHCNYTYCQDDCDGSSCSTLESEIKDTSTLTDLDQGTQTDTATATATAAATAQAEATAVTPL